MPMFAQILYRSIGSLGIRTKIKKNEKKRGRQPTLNRQLAAYSLATGNAVPEIDAKFPLL